jgi:single-strand DNA-binding protein
MFSSNVVILRGRITSEPRVRGLPSGSSVTQLDVTTRCDGAGVSVPVAVFDRPVACGAGDEVVIAGHVRRRFFRAGGVTQSRTEVVAGEVLPTRRSKSVARVLERAAALLDES